MSKYICINSFFITVYANTIDFYEGRIYYESN